MIFIECFKLHRKNNISMDDVHKLLRKNLASISAVFYGAFNIEIRNILGSSRYVVIHIL